jgi:hypothetical protein
MAVVRSLEGTRPKAEREGAQALVNMNDGDSQDLAAMILATLKGCDVEGAGGSGSGGDEGREGIGDDEYGGGGGGTGEGEGEASNRGGMDKMMLPSKGLIAQGKLSCESTLSRV